jgi:ATP-dependent Lhr-like helicase
MNEFASLDPRLQELLKKRGITEPTEPQTKAIPSVLSGEHVLLVAPTGIGKTEAAMLPILHMLAKSKKGGIRCVYVTPLRALNRDLLRRLKEFGECVDLNVAVRHGDTPQSERTAQSKNPPDVLITTPETLQITFTGKILRQHLKHVRHVIIDEIHEMAEDERGAQLAVALERLTALAGEFQRIGLSATVGSVDEISRYLVGVGRQVTVLRVSAAKDMRISVESPPEDPSDKRLADSLETDLKHIACMKRCRELICTSSLELGIDVGSADFTIQFNSPRQVTRLIQRVGRSGHRIGEVSNGKIIATDPSEIAESLAISRRAMVEELEKFAIRGNPLSVLANQLVAMTLTEARVDKDWAYSTVTKAYPFRGLLRKDFDEVITLLGDLHILWNDPATIRRKTTGMLHFYDNISMIPDEKTYKIREVTSRKIIGTLDESFVATFAEPYSTFVARGRTWRVIELMEDEVIVEEVREIAATPSWVGEEIPVPFDVAQEVGAMRRLLVLDPYPADDVTKEELTKWVKSQDKHPLPTDKRVTVEQGEGVIVVNCCFGSKVNETLSKLIAALLNARFGESIGVQTDVYSIVLETPRAVRASDVVKILKETDPSSLGQLMRYIVRNSSYLRWQFVHVAKKFGAVRKGADYKMLNVTKLIDVFEKSPIFEEAVAKTLWENMDTETASHVLRRIQEGTIELVTGALSPIGKHAIGTRKELMQPSRADKAVLNALKERLLAEDVVMVCMNCRTQKRASVGNLPEKIKCAKCGGVLMATLQPHSKTQFNILKKGPANEEQRKELRRIYKNANLVMSYGRRAVIALVARGVGPDTAARILAKQYSEEDEFLRDILAAEIMYARTKKFWD